MESNVNKHLLWYPALAAALTIPFHPPQAEAHGFAGQRFFPATIQTDDPFVAD
jgi:hypothetical protein